MNPTRQAEWARRLRPLHLGDSPLAAQLARRRGVVIAASVLLVGLIGFILAIFAGFGRWEIGLGLGGCLFGVPLGWIWWDYLWLRRAVHRFEREQATQTDPREKPG